MLLEMHLKCIFLIFLKNNKLNWSGLILDLMKLASNQCEIVILFYEKIFQSNDGIIVKRKQSFSHFFLAHYHYQKLLSLCYHKF